jgi:hypothetical protein
MMLLRKEHQSLEQLEIEDINTSTWFCLWSWTLFYLIGILTVDTVNLPDANLFSHRAPKQTASTAMWMPRNALVRQQNNCCSTGALSDQDYVLYVNYCHKLEAWTVRYCPEHKLFDTPKPRIFAANQFWGLIVLWNKVLAWITCWCWGV